MAMFLKPWSHELQMWSVPFSGSSVSTPSSASHHNHTLTKSLCPSQSYIIAICSAGFFSILPVFHSSLVGFRFLWVREWEATQNRVKTLFSTYFSTSFFNLTWHFPVHKLLHCSQMSPFPLPWKCMPTPVTFLYLLGGSVHTDQAEKEQKPIYWGGGQALPRL